MRTIERSSVALLVLVSLGLLVHCGDEAVPSTTGIVEPSSSCPDTPPEGGACFGVVSCTFVDGDCDTSATFQLHQCFCNADIWACSTAEAQCGAGGSGGSGTGGSGTGGSGGSGTGGSGTGGSGGAAGSGGSGGAGGGMGGSGG